MRYFFLVCSVSLAFGQGTRPKPTPEDYEAHAQARSADIGAEFTVHSFSRGEEAFVAEDFLVVEVALYPLIDETISVRNGNFTLRINGRKPVLEAQAPSVVATSLQHPGWGQPSGPAISAEGSLGNVGVILGGPQRTPFPGSNPPGSQPPPPVQVPRDNPSGVEKKRVKPDELLLETALPEGEHHTAVSGFLYFAYRGKINSIKTLDLLYEDAVLKLR